MATKGVIELAGSPVPGNTLQLLYGSVVWNPGDIEDKDNVGTSIEAKDVTVAGAALGDICIASLDVDITDLTISATVTAANTVSVVLFNGTATATDIGAAGTICNCIVFHFVT